jgi:hypothetical protein
VRDEREYCRQVDWRAVTEIVMVRSMVNTGGEMERAGRWKRAGRLIED